MKSILLLIAIAVIYFILRREFQRNPAQFTRRFAFALIAFLLVGLLLLAFTGRLHWLFALFGAALPFVGKLSSYFRAWPSVMALHSLWKKLGGANYQTSDARSDTSMMSREEALKVLGLHGNPDKQEILESYKKLMQKLHPDKGGNEYMAAKLNEARTRLLKDLDY